MRRKNREVLLCPAGWSGLSCLEGGGGLGSFWKAAAGKERLRSFLSRQVKLSETSLFLIPQSYLESWRHPLCRVLAGCECKSVLTLWDSKLIPESTERRFESSVFELLAAEEEEEEEEALL